MRVALDSSIIIYAEDMFTDQRRNVALELLATMPAESLVLPLQATGEALNWLVRKGKVPKILAVTRMARWLESYNSQATTLDVLDGAYELIADHDFQVWDAVILSASSEAGATILLSEDMQDGFRWRGVTIVNPFAATPHPLLLKILNF